MKKRFLSLILLYLITLRNVAAPAYNVQAINSPSLLNQALRTELLAMAEQDQQLREQLRISLKNTEHRIALEQKIRQLNHTHAIRMHEILDIYGWPGHDTVDLDGSTAAWLLIQHADHDRVLQQKAIELLTDAVNSHNASASNLAFLVDRILINQGALQRYGTQLEEVNGHLVPKPMENHMQVDKRRKEMGMDTMAEYIMYAEACMHRQSK